MSALSLPPGTLLVGPPDPAMDFANEVIVVVDHEADQAVGVFLTLPTATSAAEVGLAAFPGDDQTLFWGGQDEEHIVLAEVTVKNDWTTYRHDQGPDRNRPRPFLTDTVCTAYPDEDDPRAFARFGGRTRHFLGSVAIGQETMDRMRAEGWVAVPASTDLLFLGGADGPTAEQLAALAPHLRAQRG